MTAKNSRTAIDDLKNALITLLNEKPYEDISITELCDQAGVNRGSFYYHFVDKDDMIRQFKEQIMADLHEHFAQTNLNYKEMITSHLTYLSDNMSLIHAAYKAGAIDLNEIIADVIKDIFTLDHHQFDLEEVFNLPEEYAMKTYMSAITIIMTDWIANKGDKSVEEMYELINNLERASLESDTPMGEE